MGTNINLFYLIKQKMMKLVKYLKIFMLYLAIIIGKLYNDFFKFFFMNNKRMLILNSFTKKTLFFWRGLIPAK